MAAPSRTTRRARRAPARVWTIDMGDGTWAACCTHCRLDLGRGPARQVECTAAAHVCGPHRGAR